jgi:hypothetical protein
MFGVGGTAAFDFHTLGTEHAEARPFLWLVDQGHDYER